MNQRAAFIAAAGLTAFVLVLVGALSASIAGRPASAASQLRSQPVGDAGQALVAPGTPDGRGPAGEARRAPAGYAVTPNQAAAMALEAVPEAKLTTTPELVSFQGAAAYEVLLDRGVVYVDANAGRVLHNGALRRVATGLGNGGAAGEEQAIQAATDYLGGGSAVEVELERERGMLVYEVKFAGGAEVYVDAETGEVVHAEDEDPGRGDEGDDDD